MPVHLVIVLECVNMMRINSHVPLNRTVPMGVHVPIINAPLRQHRHLTTDRQPPPLDPMDIFIPNLYLIQFLRKGTHTAHMNQ